MHEEVNAKYLLIEIFCAERIQTKVQNLKQFSAVVIEVGG